MKKNNKIYRRPFILICRPNGVSLPHLCPGKDQKTTLSLRSIL
jgi:hypothetical protein